MPDLFKRFMETIEYRVNDAFEHQWKSYTNGQAIGYQEEGKYAALMVFNRDNQEVIEMSIFDQRPDGVLLPESRKYFYRWVNPDYKEEILEESKTRRVDFSHVMDDDRWEDLELAEDFLEKCRALLNDEPIDERHIIPLELDDDELLELFKMAHAKDMTFNRFIADVLERFIEEKFTERELNNV